MPYMIDMDDPDHLLRRKLVNAGFTRKQLMDKAAGIETLCNTLVDAVCERGECDFVRGPRRAAADGRHRRHARGSAGRTGHPAEVVRRPGVRAEFGGRRGGGAGADGAFAGYQAFAMETIARRRAEPAGTCSQSWPTPRSTATGCRMTKSSSRRC